jgi:hypothetical protein
MPAPGRTPTSQLQMVEQVVEHAMALVAEFAPVGRIKAAVSHVFRP